MGIKNFPICEKRPIKRHPSVTLKLRGLAMDMQSSGEKPHKFKRDRPFYMLLKVNTF